MPLVHLIWAYPKGCPVPPSARAFWFPPALYHRPVPLPHPIFVVHVSTSSLPARASLVVTASHSFSSRRLDLTRWLAKPMQLDLTVSFRQNVCHEGFGHARSAGPDSVRLRYRKAFLPHDQYHGGFERCSCHVSCAQWS